MTRPTKAKRKLSQLDFSSEGAHIALTAAQQGGPANGHDYALVMKSANFSEEFIQKVQQVRVTMELPDFLMRFMHLYYEDAQVLAYMMGYVEEPESKADEKMEAESEFQDWIKEKMQAFEIVKSLYEAESVPEVISKLSEDQYMSLLKDQEFFEKSLKKSKKSPKVVKATEATSTSVEKVEAEASEVNKSLEKKPMTTEVQTIETEVEVVAKDKFVELQKALDQQKEQLEKALAQVAKFEAERKEALLKARKEEVLKAVKIAEHAEVIFKAVAEASDDDFKAVVKSLEALTVVVEKSDLFVEKGANKQEAPAVNGLEQILKAKYSKK